MIQYRMGGVKVAEFHFDEPVRNERVDIIRYRARTEPLEKAPYEEQATVVVDLRADPDTLLANMNATTRHQIRKAAKDNLDYEYHPDPDGPCITEFVKFYDQFSKAKGISPANRVRLNALRVGYALNLSHVGSSDGSRLVWHAYIRNAHVARVLYSASLFRDRESEDQALIGRANRYHHWMDMLRFRDASVATYDLGGWYSGVEDEQKLRINRFKAGFGGQVVSRFNADYSRTWKGALALGLKRTPNLQRAVDLLKLRYSQ